MSLPLSETEIAFIQANLHADVSKLLLAKPVAGLDTKKMAEQIRARQKTRSKLPSWCANPELIFPAALSVEQASSELTARYKASLLDSETIIDLTGGMGVDSWAFAGVAQRVFYVERDEKLVQIAAHNLGVLKIKNVEVQQGEALDFDLKNANPANTTIYLDPHRRGNANQKLVKMADYEPNITQYLPILFQQAQRVVVKVSPLIDLTQAQRDLPNISQIHVVAVDNEVKEVLLILEKPATPVRFFAVNLSYTHPKHVFTFDPVLEKTTEATYSFPLKYLYEPNAAILKAGAFRTVAARFGLFKIGQHSHLYTSQNLVANFAGRTFEVVAVCKADPKELRAHLPAGKANLTVRNFPMKTDDLKHKLSLKDGGDVYLLATTLHNGDKRLIVTQKITNTHVF